jgi:hypothetical protein
MATAPRNTTSGPNTYTGSLLRSVEAGYGKFPPEAVAVEVAPRDPKPLRASPVSFLKNGVGIPKKPVVVVNKQRKSRKASRKCGWFKSRKASRKMNGKSRKATRKGNRKH